MVWGMSFNFCFLFIAYAHPVVPGPFTARTFLTPWNFLGIFVKIQWPKKKKFVFLDSIFCSTSLHICPWPEPYCLDYCGFIGNFWNLVVVVPQHCSFLKTVLAILTPLHFHKNFTIILSISIQKSLLGFW